MTKSGPVRVDTVLSEILAKHGVQDQVQRMSVLELWPEIVGPQIGKVTSAKGVDDATLFDFNIQYPTRNVQQRKAIVLPLAAQGRTCWAEAPALDIGHSLSR